MLYVLSALAGAILFFGGFYVGRRTVPVKIDPQDIAVTAWDSKRERAAKMDAQYFNLMNYTGRRQTNED